MKKIIIKLLIWLSLFGTCNFVFAETQQEMLDRQDRVAEGNTIFTSEKVPGADCTCVDESYSDNYGTIIPKEYIDSIEKEPNSAISKSNWTYSFSTPQGQTIISKSNCWNPATRKYKCTVTPGLSWFQTIFAEIVRTVVFIVMLLGVLAIVGLGIAWAWAGGEDIKMKSTLKSWGINILIGLAILFLFRYILTFIAPWIYK
jgi:hypothetical protein